MKKIELETLTENTVENQKTFEDELREKVINNLLDMTQNSKVNSRLNKAQVHAITKLFLFSKIYKNEFAENLANMILHLQVSLNGLGRRELVQILEQNNINELTHETKPLKDVFR